MSNFLYQSGNVIQDIFTHNLTNYKPIDQTVLCDQTENLTLNFHQNLLFQNAKINYQIEHHNKTLWNSATVPIFLGIFIFPTLFIDNVVIFAKFNALGTVSVVYIIVMGLSKMWMWGGLHITREQLLYYNVNGMFKFSGMLALGLFIHNAIITIFRKNRNQDKNGRDLLIAFVLTASTYLIVGMIFFVSFPIAKSCISDNILNNLERYDLLSTIARFFLLFQLSMVFPLLAYLFRSTCYSFLFENNKDGQAEAENKNCLDEELLDASSNFPENIEINQADTEPLLLNSSSSSRSSNPDQNPSIQNSSDKTKKIFYLIFNIITLLSCILVAIFFPKIGKIISLIGSVCGGIYIFYLPSIIYFKESTWVRKIYFVMIMTFGLVNVVFQFLE